MSSIGTNPTHSIAAGGCGMPPALPRPAGTTVGGAFSLPTPPAGSGIAPERFAHSAAGGVIVGKDGAPAGRIPAGSFVDVKAGTVYGADGKAIAIPEGATVDFFDLPDLDVMRNAPSAAAPLFGGGASAPGKTQVDGQWGPGGVTPIKGGGTPPADCGMDHGPTKAGGPASTSTSTGTTVAAGGTTATMTSPITAELNRLIETLQKQVATLTGTTAATTTAGGSTAVAGANSLGSTSSLSSALTDLVAAIRELGEAIRQSPVLGGGPGQKPPGKDLPPTKPPTTPPTTQLPPSSPPTTQVPPTTTPPTTSNSGSTSGSSDTTAPASGSSSS